ncbi:MAG: cyclic pyranopterin monophosphate synthase MoaC [Pseudomonadota bacterium]
MTKSGRLTHFDAEGRAQMVDVSEKPVTARIATAVSEVHMRPETLALIRDGRAKKGDVLAVARLAGIMATKKTHDLIPLCHPLQISKVTVDLDLAEDPPRVLIRATVKTTGQTGVEMEALTAASTAALTVYDMVKAVDRGMVISQTKVTFKDGGASGRYEVDI